VRGEEQNEVDIRTFVLVRRTARKDSCYSWAGSPGQLTVTDTVAGILSLSLFWKSAERWGRCSVLVTLTLDVIVVTICTTA
jgi:hypothetical protein